MILLQILATILSIVGGVFIIFVDRRGYMIWIVSNFVWILIFILSHLYISIIPFAFYQGVNVAGWLKWRDRENE